MVVLEAPPKAKEVPLLLLYHLKVPVGHVPLKVVLCWKHIVLGLALALDGAAGEGLAVT